MTPPRPAPRQNRKPLKTSGHAPQEPQKENGEPKWRQHGFEGKYEVVYSRIAFRSAASTKSTLVHVAKQGTVLTGTVEIAEGQAWLRLSEPFESEVTHVTCTAYVLIHGGSVGLGDLLRPLHERAEQLEALLRRLAGQERSRVDPLIKAVKDSSIYTGSQLLATTEHAADREKLNDRIKDEAAEQGVEVPNQIVSCIRSFVEDSRLAFSGFPYSPPNTKNRILFTAPHSLPLVRPGHRPHLPEKLTSYLAREFANICSCAYLTWTQREDARALEYFKCEGVPDITNRDPNFTPRDALNESPWTRNLSEVKGLWGPDRPCLHVDLHGCKDPGLTEGSHLVIGLRAMEFAGRAGFAEIFRKTLLSCLSVALRGMSVNLRPQKQLTGALEDNCCTLSQQSLTLEGGSWTCSVQMEMSRSLRKRLATDKEVRTLMAQAILNAWSLTMRDVVDPPAFTHQIGYWAARCKALYSKVARLQLDSPTDAKTAVVVSRAEPVNPTGKSGDAEPVTPTGKSGDAACLKDVESAEPSGTPKAEEDNDEEVVDVEPEEEEETNEGNTAEDCNTAAAETAGGATANSEPRPPDYDHNYEEVAENLVKFSKLIEGGEKKEQFQTGHHGVLETRATRVSLFRDWLRSPYEYDTVLKLAGDEPLMSYGVAGSWNDYHPEAMTWNGARFEYTVQISSKGSIEFQIWKNGEAKEALYPSKNNAGPFVRYQLSGPDNRGHGKNWMISPKTGSECSPGDTYRIGLVVDAEENAIEVGWELMKRAPLVKVQEITEPEKSKKEEVTEEGLTSKLRREKREEEARKKRDAEAQQKLEEEYEEKKVQWNLEREREQKEWEMEEAVRQADALRQQLDEEEEAKRFLQALFGDDGDDADNSAETLPAESNSDSSAPALGELLQVTVYIERDLGLCMHAEVNIGSTVQALKNKLAETDLTGSTDPESIQLSLGNGSEPLDNADLITADHAELDIWVPGT